MEKYTCGICGWEYSEADGCPELGISSGTPWSDVPDDFECPECSAPKGEFSKRSAGRIYVCSMCGFRYEESKGSEKLGAVPGTLWEQFPEDFKCPLCGCGKNIFKRFHDERR